MKNPKVILAFFALASVLFAPQLSAVNTPSSADYTLTLKKHKIRLINDSPNWLSGAIFHAYEVDSTTGTITPTLVDVGFLNPNEERLVEVLMLPNATLVDFVFDHCSTLSGSLPDCDTINCGQGSIYLDGVGQCHSIFRGRCRGSQYASIQSTYNNGLFDDQADITLRIFPSSFNCPESSSASRITNPFSLLKFWK